MKINSRYVWLLVLIVLSSTVVFFLVTKAKEPNTIKSEARVKPALSNRKKARQILAEPIHIEPPTNRVQVSTSESKTTSGSDMRDLETEQACEAEWQKFLGVKADEWLLQALEQSDALDPKCLALVESLLGDKSMIDGIKKCIIDSKLVDQSNKPTESCIEAALMFRATAVEFLFRKNTDYKNQTEEVLLNRIMAGFVTKKQTPENVDKLIQMTDALIENDPNSYPASKARASLLFLKQANFNTGDQTLIDEALDRCANLNPDDLEIQESRIALPAVFGNPTEMDRRAKELLKVNPENPVALYFNAGALWQAGNAKEAIATLEKVVKIAPGVARYSATLENIRKAKPREKGLFSISMSVSLLND